MSPVPRFWPTERQWTTQDGALNRLTRATYDGGNRAVVRLFVNDGTAIVYGAKSREVVEVARFDGVTVERSGSAYRLVMSDGAVWDLAQGGCGCGSPLKNFTPAGASA